MADGKVVIQTDIDDSKVTKGLDKIDDSMKDTAKEAEKMSDSIKKSSKSFDLMDMASNALSMGMGNLLSSGIQAVIGGLKDLANQIVDDMNEINDLSQTVGMTTTEYQEMDAVLKQAGFSMAQASNNFANFNEKMLSAASGAGENAQYMKELGVSITDTSGKMRSSNELIRESIESLRTMEDVSRRNAISTQLFGNTGEALNQVLNLTKEEMDNIIDTASIISEEDIASVNGFANNIETLKNRLKGEFYPILAKIYDALRPMINAFMELATVVLNIAEFALTPITLALKGVFAVIGPLIEEISKLVNAFVEFFNVGTKEALASGKKMEDSLAGTNSSIRLDQEEHYDDMLKMQEDYNERLKGLTDAEKLYRQTNLSQFESELRKKYDLANIHDAKAYQKELDRYKSKLDRQLGLDEKYLKEKSDMYKRWLDTNQITLDKYNQLMGSIGGGSSYSQSRSVSNTTNYNTYNVSGNEAYGFMKEQVNINRRL